VLSSYNSSSEIDFSGIFSANGGFVDLSVSYRYNGTSTVVLGVSVNQVAAGNVTLEETERSRYADAVLNHVSQWKGTNFINLYGGGDELYIVGLIVQ
jgi:hypothetical protein